MAEETHGQEVKSPQELFRDAINNIGDEKNNVSPDKILALKARLSPKGGRTVAPPETIKK